MHFSSNVASFHITMTSSCGSELCGDFSEVNIVRLMAACITEILSKVTHGFKIVFVTRFLFISQQQRGRKHKQQLGHKRKSKLNGAKIRIQSARCDTAASQGCEGGGGGGDAAGELNFPIACYYRTNKLQSGTLCSLPHCPHCSLHPVTLGNATRGCKGGSCARQPPSEITFTRKPVLPVNQTNFLLAA